VSTLKKLLVNWLRSRVNPWKYSALKIELYAAWVELRNRIDPRWIRVRHDVARRTGILANVGCGPTGQPGWVNIDLFAGATVTMATDCRRRLPFADGACRGIHVEHFFEHLHSVFEKPAFLAECRRCLEPNGVLRIIVPDAHKYIEAYLAPGWDMMNSMGSEDDLPEKGFPTKMQALNHVFMQDEHYGGIDAEFLSKLMGDAGFREIEVVDFGKGHFPGGCVDLPLHRKYSLYMEARR